MIDWTRYSTEPTDSTLNDYPTAIDILKDIVGLEEEEAMYDMPLDMLKSFMRNPFEYGRYVMEYEEQLGFPVLRPSSRSPFTYYRGQYCYYKSCLPSLYRFEGEKLEEETVRSYFQTAEMVLVMKTHPVIRFLETRGIMNDKLGCVPLVVMYDGLAQHYGINTCYMDFTNDIWTAIFFATTEFKGKDCYPKLVKESDEIKERFGVIYRLDYDPRFGFDDSAIEDIMPIGLQYFNRPGRQFGFVRKMSDVRDLHKVPRLERIFFRHDNEVAKLLFSLSQFGKKYMPEDSLVGIVERIREDNRFCNQTIELVRRIYYPTLTAEEVKSKAMKYGFAFQDHLKVNFPKDDVNAEYQEWLNGRAQRYKDNIIITPVAHVSDSVL